MKIGRKWYRVYRESYVNVVASSEQEAREQARFYHPEQWRNEGIDWGDRKGDTPFDRVEVDVDLNECEPVED